MQRLRLPDIFHNTPALDAFNRLHHINIAMRITGNAVARTELRVAPLRQALTFSVQYADEPAVVLRDIDRIRIVHIEKIAGPIIFVGHVERYSPS